MFIALLMFLTTLEKGPYRVIMWQCDLSCRNREIGMTKSSGFRGRCLNITLSALFSKRIMDGDQYPDDPSAALADFKVMHEKARTQTHQKFLRNTTDCLGAKTLDCFNRITCLQKHTFGHDALLCGLGTHWKMLRALLLRVYRFSWPESNYRWTSRGKEMQNEKRKYITFPGHRRRKTMPWLNADSVFVVGVPRNRCSLSTQLPMKTVTSWRMKTRLCERHPTRPFSNTCRKLPTIFSGTLTSVNLMK